MQEALSNNVNPGDKLPNITRLKKGISRVALATSLVFGGGLAIASISEGIQLTEVAAETMENGPYNFNNEAVVNKAMLELGVIHILLDGTSLENARLLQLDG